MDLTSIAEVKSKAVEVLGDAGIRVYDHYPSSLITPCSFIDSGRPFVVRDSEGWWIVRININVVGQATANDDQTQELDELIMQHLSVLRHEFNIEQVGAYEEVVQSQQSYLMAPITVLEEIAI